MRRRKVRVALVVVAISALAVAVPLALTSGGGGGKATGARDGEMPTALAGHLAKLHEAIPGNGGESAEGPGSAEEQTFESLAFPAADVSAASLEGQRSAADVIAKKGFPSGKGRKGTWVSIGPSEALYPASPFRNVFSYVPAAYVAAQRTTAMAIDRTCDPGHCRMWIGPAGGGVWRTDNALTGEPHWTFLSTPFEMNTIGSIVQDPNDPTGNTLWVGTGEGNTCSSGCVSGVGLYKTTDGGDTWTGPYGKNVFNFRGVGTIAIDPRNPNVIYAGSAQGKRGMPSVCCSGVTYLISGAPRWGLYKSTDGGTTWSYIFNGAASTAGCTGDITEATDGTPCSPRGVRRVALDPSNPNTVYASAYARGIWRSTDGGATWTQILAPLIHTPAVTTDRAEFAVTTLANGKTRMYVAEGAAGTPFSRVFRSDDVTTATPVFTQLTSATNDPSTPAWATRNYCTGQCWYDNYVYTPAGHPDMVYVLGSYQYGEIIADHRAVLLSQDAGATFTDQTFDATDALHPNGIHPDQHIIVTNPSNPLQFWEGSDGGVVRSSGELTDGSAVCASRGLDAVRTARCQQMLSAIPTELESMNHNITTLQFWSLSVNPFNVNDVQGGTQDNGTWENYGNSVKWQNTMIGDGGQSGFDVADPHFRFHTFFEASPDVNFSDGDTADWNWISDPIFETEGQQFYVPIISDPKVSKTMYVGTEHVWRTKTAGMGSMDLATFRQHCNEWTGDFTVKCGDWVPLGGPKLTDAALGTRAGGNVAAVERAPSDTGTLWAATTTGRIFVSKNADAEPAGSVTFTRIDTASTPNRFVSSIYIDPANPNHAWVSYTGFNVNTPGTPGHVFEVTFNPGTGTATFTNLDNGLGDMPITDLVRDDATGDLYASDDFGVITLPAGGSGWTAAAPGMPNVEVSGLTIVPAKRKLFAATHGFGAWSLNLP
jgi:hypothetical protein